MRLLYFLLSLWIIFCFVNPAFAKHKPKHHATSRSTKKTLHQNTAHTRHHAHQPSPPKKVTSASRLSSPSKKPRPAAIPAIYYSSQLATALNRMIATDSPNAYVSLYVKSLKYQDTLYLRNINRVLTPASTLKILTAEAALLYLGPDYRFSTQLLTDATTIKDGVLQGNLYIILSGDPSLTYSDLFDLFANLATHDIHSIKGNVYIDDTAYDQDFYGPGWEWKDRNYYYAAPISASIINHNCLSFKVVPAKLAGQPAEIVTSPKYFYPLIRNTVLTKATRTRNCTLRLSKNPGSILTVDGCIPKGNYAWGVSYVITDVPEYTRALFRNLLRQQSIPIGGMVTFAAAPQNLSLIGSHTSDNLRQLITEMLKKSDNVIAGALFKKMGQLYTHQPGSWENGRYAVSRILSERARVNISGLRILDGSGLSPDNLVSAAQIMQVLDFAYHAKTAPDFITALPIAGVDGTLKNRMGNIAYKVHAKTGTISGVVTLAGYVTTADHEPLAFVIMINGSKGWGWRYKSMEDKIATALTKYKR